MNDLEIFKECSNCKFVWGEREKFLADKEIVLSGYQVNFQHLREGLFLFNHSCGTTMAIRAQEFADFYKGPFFKKRFSGSDTCSEYCMNEHELQLCPIKCECAAVREILHLVRIWPKE